MLIIVHPEIGSHLSASGLKERFLFYRMKRLLSTFKELQASEIMQFGMEKVGTVMQTDRDAARLRMGLCTSLPGSIRLDIGV